MDHFEIAYADACAAQQVEPCPAVITAMKESGNYEQPHLDEEEFKDGEQFAALQLRLNGNSLSLFKRRLTDDDVIPICTAIQNTVFVSQIVDIDLSYNAVSNRGAKALQELICAPGSSLAHLNLNQNDIGVEGVEHLVTALRDVDCPLSHLSLNGNKFGNEGGMLIASMLKDNENLRSLDIGNTEQEQESIVAIATVLQHQDTLEAINLDNPRLNSFGEETTIHLAHTLRYNKTLRSVSLAKHGMRDEGVRILSEYLIENKTLQSLDLSCNEIGIGGARAIALFLANSSILESLNLQANRVKDDGAQAIGDAIVYNDSLRNLNLESNRIQDEGLTSLLFGVSRNEAVKKFSIWGNRFGPTSSDLLYDIVCVKKSSVLFDVVPYIAEYDGDGDSVQIARA